MYQEVPDVTNVVDVDTMLFISTRLIFVIHISNGCFYDRNSFFGRNFGFVNLGLLDNSSIS